MIEPLFFLSVSLFLYSLFPDQKGSFYILWTLLFSWGWLRWFFQSQLKIPFTRDLVFFIPHLPSFKDSIRHLKIKRSAGLGLVCLSGSFLLLFPSVLLWGQVSLFLGALACGKWKRGQKKEKGTLRYEWRFEGEISTFLSTDYPLLRKTYGFKGKRRIAQISIDKPHIIFLFLESFRAKNIGCLGSSLPFSPRFDALAEQGTLFTQFYANGLQTFRAMISSFFGIPAHLKTMSLRPFCSIPLIGLPEILKGNGYQSALLQASYASFDWTFPFFHKHGFDTIMGRENFSTDQKTSWGIPDEFLLSFAADWLLKQEKPTFLSLFTISNHHPWESPLAFPTPKELPSEYSRYLQTFAYTDHCLGLFIEQLKRSGLLEKSIVFVMGDHGQEMGERGPHFAVHNNLYQENIHVPLLILGTEKKRIEDPASQIDLLPTVLDLLNLPAIHHSVGKSLLRENKATLFFSMPREEEKVGCIKGSKKLILGGGEEFYHLPNETQSFQAPEKMKEEVLSFFEAVKALYAQSAWAPSSLEKIPFEIKAPAEITDSAWADFIHNTPPSPILDLSNSSLTDKAIWALGGKATHIHELNLSNSPFFTDRALEWIATHCPRLSILNAANCLLLTHKGLNAILNECAYLRYLNLEGIEDLTDLEIQKPIPLSALHLKGCLNLEADALVRICSQCPHLDYFVASLRTTENSQLLQMAKHLDQLLYLSLENGLHITDASLQGFIDANPRLSILILENFPQLLTIDLSQKKWLNTVAFINCPSLSDATLFYLEGLAIESLTLISCPSITEKGLEKIHPKCKITNLASVDAGNLF